jgi:hypothetical protein
VKADASGGRGITEGDRAQTDGEASRGELAGRIRLAQLRLEHLDGRTALARRSTARSRSSPSIPPRRVLAEPFARR